MDEVSQSPTKIKILVVEDDSVVALHLRHFLEDWNYEVPTILAAAGTVLEAIAEYQPNLVLIDIRLPGNTDGIEAAREIRDRFSLPVVFTTAHRDESTFQRALKSEPFGYIFKPFQAKELQTTIAIALGRHQVEQNLKLILQDMTQPSLMHTTLQRQNSTLRQNYTNMLVEVQAQSRQLQQTLSYARLLQRLLYEVRDSLDEQHILSVAIAELGEILQAECCWLALQNSGAATATVTYEYQAGEFPSALNVEVQLPDVQQGHYQHIRNPQVLSTSNLLPAPYRRVLSQEWLLVWPLINEQQVIGQLGAVIPAGITPELLQLQGELGGHVSAYCTIALRQARLYQSAQGASARSRDPSNS